MVAAPGVAVDRELPLERLCGWSGLGVPLTRAQSGCPGGPRELRAGGAPLVVGARGRDGVCLRRTGAPQSRLAETCGCLGAGHLRQPQRCGCAGQEAAGCGGSGVAQSGLLRCNQIGFGLCVKGLAGTEWKWGPGGREGLVLSKGAGPWLLWPPLSPSPRCWGPRPSPLLTGLVSVATEPRGEGGDSGILREQARYNGGGILQILTEVP